MAERNSKIKFTLQCVDCYTHKRKQTAQYNKPIKTKTKTHTQKLSIFIVYTAWWMKIFTRSENICHETKKNDTAAIWTNANLHHCRVFTRCIFCVLCGTTRSVDTDLLNPAVSRSLFLCCCFYVFTAIETTMGLWRRWKRREKARIPPRILRSGWSRTPR